MDNEKVVKGLYDRLQKGNNKQVMISGQDLISVGWQGRLPNEMFIVFGDYRIRLDKALGQYKIVKTAAWMFDKKAANTQDPNTPLPIKGKYAFNLKELYKNGVKDLSNIKESKKDE